MSTATKVVKVYTFRPEAERAQEKLRAVGIASTVAGDDASGWAPHVGAATGGVRLCVEAVHLEQAAAVLKSSDEQADA